ncbi:MAG: 3-hydroxyacyl-CoA dehydrogenase NAD-binding domain-containing protein [Gammaproteobacteria bacterium]
MSSPVSYTLEGSIGVISVNNPPVNALSQAVRQGIFDAIAEAERDAGKVVLILCEGRTFIAGAEISEFGQPPAEPWLPEVFDRLEALEKPVVAALHGTALGGGFETALAAHYRCALPSAKIGLPEIKLGLLPGAGGTQRTPRLAGVEAALELMTTGNPIPAGKAFELGLIDKIIDDDLRAGAMAWAEELIGAPVRRSSEQPVPEHDAGIFDAARGLAARKARGQVAPQCIIDCVEAATHTSYQDGVKIEREKFMELMQGEQSVAMRHLFFAERQAAKIVDLPSDTPRRAVETVGIIGGGTMGGGIAMSFANAGMPVTLIDISDEALERGLAIVDRNYAGSVKRGKLSEDKAGQCRSLITGSTDYADLADVDLVVEAVFEDPELKKQIFTRLDESCKPGAILATNTSYQDVNVIAAATRRPEDVIGLHFFSPANIMKLLEVVRAEKTAPDALATVMKLSKAIGKVGVVSGVCYGFIGNRMLEGYRREANLMLLEGATVEQIDKAMYDFGMPMGPFAMADLAGVDVGVKIRRERKLAGTLVDDPRDGVISEIICDMGRHGQKTGAGFYRYEAGSRAGIPDPEIEQLVRREAERLGIEQRAISNEEIVSRCVYPMINTGAKILEEGIAMRASDIDVVWVYGYGFPPYRGGPMKYADTVGVKAVCDTICENRERLGSDFGYWEAAPLLKELADNGGSFNQG